MERWTLETQGTHRILTHDCPSSQPHDSHDILHQDIGGGYVRCTRCGDKYLPVQEPGNPRILFRLKAS